MYGKISMIFLDLKKNELHNNMHDINTLSTLNMKICVHIARYRGGRMLGDQKGQIFWMLP